MTDIASDLRARFDFAVLWFHEKCELDPNSLLDDEHTIVDLTDDEARAVRILESLARRHGYAAARVVAIRRSNLKFEIGCRCILRMRGRTQSIRLERHAFWPPHGAGAGRMGRWQKSSSPCLALSL
jgi:hypothetical protein